MNSFIDELRENMAQSELQGHHLPNAVALATATADGQPSVRTVLLKDADDRGLVFYTNLESRKASELATNPRAALCFWWGALERQVHFEGPVTVVDPAEADEYFAIRPRASQIGAWASQQSRELKSREHLLAEVARVEALYANSAVPRPPHWSGYRLAPDRVEFWYGREDRLHERKEYRLEGTRWVEHLLNP